MEQLAVTGHSLEPEKFVLPEVDHLTSREVNAVFNGESAGFICRRYLPQDACDKITHNYLRSAGLHARTDDVRGNTVGADLYHSDPDTYIPAALCARRSVEDLFLGTTNVTLKLQTDIQRSLPSGVVIRSAIHNGIEFNRCRAVGWTDTGTYALKHHDDLASLSATNQHGLETARVRTPVAWNIYTSVTEYGGELELVNVSPDVETKHRLGIAESGYPYPNELLRGFARIAVRPQPGDLVVIAGSLVHGVRGIEGKGIRLLLNQFAGYIDKHTIVMWS